MIKGFYAAASAMVAGMRRQNVLSHNIANADTPGFRQIMMTMDDWYVTPIREDSQSVLPEMDTNFRRRPGYLGLGTEASPELTDFTEGTQKATSQELDFAIHGDGFFRVKTPDGERYTRDGRFDRDAKGQLVTTEGYLVLGANGQPITLPSTAVQVDENGVIRTSTNQTVGQLGIAVFTDPQNQLTREGDNKFSAAASPTGQNPGKIYQGYVETSNANMQSLMTQMVMVGRAYESAQRVVQMQDDATGKLISYLGR